MTVMVTEVETWKRKFIELNREFHKNQEDLIMTQAELDTLKNRKVQVTQQVTTTRVNNHVLYLFLNFRKRIPRDHLL